MKSNNDLLTLSEVAAYYMISKSSVRRKVKQAREQQSPFPLPIFGKGCKLLWRRSDIEDWEGENSVIEFTPSVSMPTIQTGHVKRRNQILRELKSKHAIDLSQASDKANS